MGNMLCVILLPWHADWNIHAGYNCNQACLKVEFLNNLNVKLNYWYAILKFAVQSLSLE